MKCEVCGKGYQTRSGLRRHMKAVHAGDASPGEVGVKDQESEAGPTLADPMEAAKDGFDTLLTLHADDARSKPLREACKGLGISLNKVMSFKVYDEKVVIIEGPTGWKRVWQRK